MLFLVIRPKILLLRVSELSGCHLTQHRSNLFAVSPGERRPGLELDGRRVLQRHGLVQQLGYGLLRGFFHCIVHVFHSISDLTGRNMLGIPNVYSARLSQQINSARRGA
ncbi:MAG: hypothetical protein ACRDF9_11765 [Candidatus Limnocylindria bacterium]